MAIPPFPSQDLAKLVLGYLKDEDLMTAYDEFLQASPYLDALKNEYDRIFMTSLKHILAEYRAVKIFVETCKPNALRKRLSQCFNLLEVVQYLVNNIDNNKLQSYNEQSTLRASILESQNVTVSKHGCDVCNCLKLESCVCNKNKNVSLSKSTSNTESIDTVETLVQTAPLSGLPGTYADNKHMKVLESRTNISNISHEQIQDKARELQRNIEKCNIESQSDEITCAQPQPIPNHSSVPINAAPLESSQNIAEFNSVLSQVYNKSNIIGNASNAGTFQEFAAGVRGVVKTNINVPDSSTCENMPSLLPIQNKRNIKGLQKRKCSYRVGNVKHEVTQISSEIIDVDSDELPKNPKSDEQKITILSDVRVPSDDRMIRLGPIQNNATSTPLMQVQTVLINGNPVYKTTPYAPKYTRDEIMAMPTLILVPSIGPTQNHAASIQSQTNPTVNEQPQTVMSDSSNISTSTCNTASTLGPLTVDVTDVPVNQQKVDMPSLGLQDTTSKGLVKTVDVVKNATVPKDNVVSGSSSTSTPNALPPKRKSSSTPRRTSHVRVLDFTTPRRILNGTIVEQCEQEVVNENSVEVLVSKSTNLAIPENCFIQNTMEPEAKGSCQLETNIPNESKIESEKIPVVRKKNNWDSDLRALALAGEIDDKQIVSPKPKSKRSRSKRTAKEKRSSSESEVKDKSRKKSTAKTSVSPKVKESKKKQKPSELSKMPEITLTSPDIPVKPNINIVSSAERPSSLNKDIDNKSNSDELTETPEAERTSLHNVIDAKLNISELLETPYKQALYDIQMETPRFLGPYLPDDPMSDIKIMSIPTPKFLNSNAPITPKPIATPSSYCSRPTDYSSGGSYYKPDDQDYLPVLEDIDCPVTSTRAKDSLIIPPTEKEDKKRSNPKEQSGPSKSTRPVRKCTKNVSYYNSPVVNNKKDPDKIESDSPDEDGSSEKSSLEKKLEVNGPMSQIDEKIKSHTKSASKKKHSISKTKSPLKKAPSKSFMKIKPRRPTLTKDSNRKAKKSSAETSEVVKGHTRKRTTSKDKNDSCVIIPAPAKSRRKSSTPRKLHCAKTFNSGSSNTSPEEELKSHKQRELQNSNICVQDSDTDQPALRWSDDGSQDSKLKDNQVGSSGNERDYITEIREFIKETDKKTIRADEGSLHIDLVKRGFDVETAKIIERDLLNTPPYPGQQGQVQKVLTNADEAKNAKVLDASIESDCSAYTNNLVIQEDDCEEIEFSGYECNDESTNYISSYYDDSKKESKNEVHKLKDKFCMEIDDGSVLIRLRATDFSLLFEEEQDANSFAMTTRETEIAVSSISNMDKLYTPLKDPLRAKCYEIFDSTLTSIDTPIKTDSPTKKHDYTTEIVLDVEQIEEKIELKERAENRKRKRYSETVTEESSNDNKKVRPETQYLLSSASIQNIDIESVLSKLHGS